MVLKKVPVSVSKIFGTGKKVSVSVSFKIFTVTHCFYLDLTKLQLHIEDDNDDHDGNDDDNDDDDHNDDHDEDHDDNVPVLMPCLCAPRGGGRVFRSG